MSIGLLVLTVRLPGCGSLKEKRSRLKPLLAQLHRNYNLSVAEIDDLDIWGRTVIGCTLISNDPNRTRSLLQKAANWVENEWRDLEVEDAQIELL